MKATIRVLLVNESPAALKGVCSYLDNQPGVEVVGTAANGFEVEERIRELRPHIVVALLSMPRISGLECLLSLRSRLPAIRFLIMNDVASLSNTQRKPAPANTSDVESSVESILREIRKTVPDFPEQAERVF